MPRNRHDIFPTAWCAALSPAIQPRHAGQEGPAHDEPPRLPARLPYTLVLILLGAAVLAAATAGIAAGSVALAVGDVWGIVLHRIVPGLIEPTWPVVRETIVMDVRVPRVLLCGIVGAGLSVCGMALQALVRNPLADPMLLGVSSGASVGAVLVLVLHFSLFGAFSLPLAAFGGALAALTLVYFLARSGGRMTTVRLVLAGVATAEVLSAIASYLIITSSDPRKAESAMRWMLGGFGGTSWDLVGIPAAAVLLGTVALLGVSRTLNLLLTGEEAAASMGVNVHRFRAGLFVLVALLIGAIVAVSGSIGFVGLMMPHVVRLLVGADLAARTVIAPEEIPVGILTALAGGPFFLWLMRRRAAR